MKPHPFLSLFSLGLLAATTLLPADDFTHFIRQIQLPDELEWDVDVSQTGSQQSALPINPNGARFELWTVKTSPLTSYLLDTTYVNSYIPVAEVEITSEDPYEVIPRTRADRPFTVTITVNGLTSDVTAPAAAQSVRLLRHVQSYGPGGTGVGIDRGNATLYSQGSLNHNGEHVLDYPVTSIPGSPRTKVRGEERFSIFSLADYQAPESQLDSEFIQIWPVAESDIEGLSSGEKIKGIAPEVTIDLEDLYPDSWTYAQVYPGTQVLGTEGTLVPGSSLLIDGALPRDEQVVLQNWDNVISDDGTYTLEVITVTPFGADRLAHITFEVERTIKVNGIVTSIEYTESDPTSHEAHQAAHLKANPRLRSHRNRGQLRDARDRGAAHA